MKLLEKHFENRDALIDYIRDLAPWAEGTASATQGRASEASRLLQTVDAIEYGKSRNYGNGKVTRLSPYIQHGIVSLNEIRNHVIADASDTKNVTKFIQELAWRDFWQRVAFAHPDWLWQDIEPYKTGFAADDYDDDLPDDIANGKTGIACIDHFIEVLLTTGYVHNHARMYLASYVVHFRRIKWQAGASWFLKHLLDGNLASNNFSWQWVASTFSNKPYIFNLENVDKYFGDMVETEPRHNAPLHSSYEGLSERLFPNLGSRKA